VKTRGLRKAEQLFRSHRYAEVIHLLEPQVFLYREDPHFYYLLGMSCLHTGDIGGAHSYLSRGSQLDPDHVRSQLALAAVHVRRRETGEALRLWLTVLEVDPHNRKAKQGLTLIRNAENDAAILEATEGKKIQRLLPGSGFHVPRWIFAVVAAVAIAAIVAVSLPYLLDRIQTQAPAREGNEVLNFPENEDIITYSGQFRYVMTEEEISRTFDKIGRYFNDFRDNLARREINRILNSNASSDLKRRASLLTDYIQAPTFTSFKDEFTYAQVVKEPWLYAGCYVKWRGRVSNLSIGEKEITFDFLVGYETEQVLEGVVPVRLDFAADLKAGMSLEIIGRVIADDSLRALQATSIRMIAPKADRR